MFQNQSQKASNIFQPVSFLDFNYKIGYPKHPATFEPMDLMPYQKSFYSIVTSSKSRKFHINKSRQIGFTELILRIIAYNGFNLYKGGRVMIIAGTREKTTKKIMDRFQELFRLIPDQVEETNDLYTRLKNGTEYEGFPSSSESIRGDTKIKAIFIDEAAHFKLIDDSVVLDAVKPIVETNRSDLFIISTPNGPRGFFYEIDKTQNDFVKKQYDIWSAENWLYSTEQINQMLKDPTVDVQQEYLNQYTTSRDSIFGSNFSSGSHEMETY